MGRSGYMIGSNGVEMRLAKRGPWLVCTRDVHDTQMVKVPTYNIFSCNQSKS